MAHVPCHVASLRYLHFFFFFTQIEFFLFFFFKIRCFYFFVPWLLFSYQTSVVFLQVCHTPHAQTNLKFLLRRVIRVHTESMSKAWTNSLSCTMRQSRLGTPTRNVEASIIQCNQLSPFVTHEWMFEDLNLNFVFSLVAFSALPSTYKDRSMEEKKKVCKFSRSLLKDCSGTDPDYGFMEGNPCVIIKLNRIVNFRPKV